MLKKVWRFEFGECIFATPYEGYLCKNEWLRWGKKEDH